MKTTFHRYVVWMATSAVLSIAASAQLPEREAPPRPVLSQEAAQEVEALEARSEKLREAFLRGETESVQEAIALAERVLAIRLEHQGPAAGWTDVAGNPAEWWEIAGARWTVDSLEQLRSLGAADRADLLSLVGSDEEFLRLSRLAEYTDAIALVQRQRSIRRRILGDDHPATLASIGSLGTLFRAQGELADAERYLLEALEGLRRALGDDHLHTLISLNSMGVVLRAQGRLGEAEPYQREALERGRRVLGNDHPDTLIWVISLGDLLWTQGKYSEAELYFREALEGCSRVLGDDHPRTLVVRGRMGVVLWARGRVAEAESYYREAVAGLRQALGDDHPKTLEAIGNMSVALQFQGRLAEAESYCREAVAGFRRRHGEDHPSTLASINNLGVLLEARGKLAEAERYTREALDGRRAALGDDNPATLDSVSNMGGLLAAQGKLVEAEPYYRQALVKSRDLLGSDHPSTLTSIANMGHLFHAQDRLAEAEPYLREALEGRRHVLGDAHPQTVTSIADMGRLLLAQGKLAEAEPYFDEALGLAERLRTAVIGQERERAAYAEQLKLPQIASGYAAVLVGLDRAADAFAVAERGRGRALLDLLERQSLDLVEEARKRAGTEIVALDSALGAERDARAALVEAESQVAALRKERDVHSKREEIADDERAAFLASFDEQIAEQLERVAAARREAADEGWRVLSELQGLAPDARPLETSRILQALDEDELVLSYTWTGEKILLIAVGQGVVDAAVVADGKDAVIAVNENLAAVRRAIANRPDDSRVEVDTATLLATLLPQEIRSRVLSARRLVVLADGPLTGVPLEIVLEAEPSLAGRSVVYASSATMYVNRKRAAERAGRAETPTALLVGAPIFDRAAPPEPPYPEQGALLTLVAQASNAAEGGMLRGDVILSYAGRPVAGRDDLLAAKAEVEIEVKQGTRGGTERFSVTVWREGNEIDASLAPGPMGVRVDNRTPAEGLRSMNRQARGFEHVEAEANALDQVRLFGGYLPLLPGTEREVRTIGSVLEAAGGQVELLVGEAATVGNVTKLAPNKRFVHLATHGLTGSVERPYDASLALTRPQTPGPDDIGFLRLEDLIRSWRGRLAGCDLVVLSACDTQRGVKHGDSMMALPWGFFYAGAPTVVASLWKVDDTATALLMGRFYENMLGMTPMSKADALDAAKRWLRHLSRDEVDRLSGALTMAERGQIGRRPLPDAAPRQGRPFAHPFYWAAFVLIGSPE